MRYAPRIREKRWSVEEELRLIKLWEREGLHEFDYSDRERPVFVIDTPPPYASGRWHIGAVAHYAHIDMVARAYRMLGYNVLVPFYADRNGLPVEVQVEKAYNVRAWEVPREKFIEMCKEFLDRVERELVEIVKRFGFSFQIWDKGTDSPEYRRITQATFIELYKRGLIYEAERPNNYCPRCRTTLADAELEYVREKTMMYYIKFKVKETGEDVVIATTRPELLPACLLVIYNPRDKRYKHLKGKHAIVPIFGHEVPIVEHPYARMEFGTGLVMICSFGDISDVRIIRELGLPYKVVIGEDGRMREGAGPYAGLTISEARERIARDLEREELLVKKEEVEHEVPVCWRCKTPIEYIAMKEFYLKQLDFKEDLLRLIDQVTFYPPESKQLLIDWINSVSADWPISRRRFYGTEIPIWYCKRCGEPHLPEPGRYYRPWAERAPFTKCRKCGCTEFVGETRVFDTWMDSSISPLYVSRYLTDDDFFKRAFPVSLRPQGKDIVRTWLYYTLLRIYQLTGKPAFRYVRITGMGLDERGEAMHKSKGNIIDPMPVVERYGADAIRFWAAAEAKLGSDYRYSEQHIQTGRSFVTKLWNIARFVSQFPEPRERPKLRPIDEAMLSALNGIISRVLRSYREMDVFVPANELFRFTWHVFADHYIEVAKLRAYNAEGEFSEEEQRAVWYTLHTVLKSVLKLLAPIMPFVTDAVWRRLYGGGSIHRERFPSEVEVERPELAQLIEPLMRFNSKLWSYKKSRGIALNQPLEVKVYAPAALKPFEKDLLVAHRLREIVFTDVVPNEVRREGVDLGDGVYVEAA
ncbi:MAG: valine--tRNA ligase [Thermoprotei archaeon]|nr:MAG: valine--tRNA ligase [Thermoprotei archaeon]